MLPAAKVVRDEPPVFVQVFFNDLFVLRVAVAVVVLAVFDFVECRALHRRDVFFRFAVEQSRCGKRPEFAVVHDPVFVQIFRRVGGRADFQEEQPRRKRGVFLEPDLGVEFDFRRARLDHAFGVERHVRLQLEEEAVGQTDAEAQREAVGQFELHSAVRREFKDQRIQPQIEVGLQGLRTRRSPG